MTATNGTRPPEVRHVHQCPVCGQRREIPDHAPTVWSYQCTGCRTEIEVNLVNWRDRP
jgi:ribosomal protein L37AE/L43A